MRRSGGWLAAAALVQLACLRPQAVAICEIHGTVFESDCTTPVPGMMIWAIYDLKSGPGDQAGSRVAGPFSSDAKGRFLIPRFEGRGERIPSPGGADCPASLLFIHPSRGAYTVRICSSDYPLSLPSKEMVVHDSQRGPGWTPESARASYQAISALPPGSRSIAWQHVDPGMRPR